MRAHACSIGLAIILCVSGMAGATSEELNEVTDYKLSHQREIKPEDAQKPFSNRMPRCWDRNPERVRVKVVYRDPNAIGGTAAYYLLQDTSYNLDTIERGEETFVRVRIKNATRIDMMYIHFVFGVKRDIPCE